MELERGDGFLRAVGLVGGEWIGEYSGLLVVSEENEGWRVFGEVGVESGGKRDQSRSHAFAGCCRRLTYLDRNS